MSERKPVAWARRWYIEGEKPVKVRNPETGRMVLPFRFKLHEVTTSKCLNDDVPLYPPEDKP